jgi:adenylate cyclase
MVLSSTAAGAELNGEWLLEGGDTSIALVRPHLSLGRRESCDICLRYPNVSGLHCELVFQAGYWIIRDCNSTNGVKVNGVRVAEQVLYPGDTISIAKRDYTIMYRPPIGSES